MGERRYSEEQIKVMAVERHDCPDCEGLGVRFVQVDVACTRRENCACGNPPIPSDMTGDDMVSLSLLVHRREPFMAMENPSDSTVATGRVMQDVMTPGGDSIDLRLVEPGLNPPPDPLERIANAVEHTANTLVEILMELRNRG